MINGYAAKERGARLEKFTYDPGELKDEEVEVKITHCGVCHSDLHLINDFWKGYSTYPFIPGHEVIGEVAVAGKKVSSLKIGDRVGIGWQAGSCMNCEWCISGREHLCKSKTVTCVGRHGGFADFIRADSRFAYLIPENLGSENAAPLLCAGLTVFSPLKHHNISAADRVGIVGIGGLGHLAIQFAKKFGCEVTAISTTAGKEEEARRFGAGRFLVSSDRPMMANAGESLDYIISTIAAEADWNLYFNLLRPNGKLIIVGAAPGNFEIPVTAVIRTQKTICGSATGGRADMREMLDFAARNNITAMTETLPMRAANEAVEKVRSNKARYRVVLKN
ncbi:MAG TPA: NAD(P)-dependent alcohol dehydrogenase [Candidatus Wallbacteria bacterium]|nr:MAG: Aldehyde reductase Ahr [bacterium ADurb.Bin243]HOD41111.1 NAD(P)-dependent alcohol dehydrogenase [Candidatus Wallbacteria bacterium]HPG56321.1 NAD(P)-dependent alcohol dehydrogenase [Candidatus Wallbacteria bacterium]